MTTALVSQKEEAEEEQELDKKEQKTFEEPGGLNNGVRGMRGGLARAARKYCEAGRERERERERGPTVQTSRPISLLFELMAVVNTVKVKLLQCIAW